MPDDQGSLLGSGDLKGLQSAGLILTAAGAVQQTIGGFYAALANRYQLRSRSLDLELAGSLADLNARSAERDAQALLEAGRRQSARTSLEFGRLRAANRTQIAASGVQVGAGSAAEVQASVELARQIDTFTIERNALRAANAARARRVDFENRALLARTAARSLRRSERSVRPLFSVLTGLLSGAGSVANQALVGSRLDRLLAQQGTSGGGGS